MYCRRVQDPGPRRAQESTPRGPAGRLRGVRGERASRAAALAADPERGAHLGGERALVPFQAGIQPPRPLPGGLCSFSSARIGAGRTVRAPARVLLPEPLPGARQQQGGAGSAARRGTALRGGGEERRRRAGAGVHLSAAGSSGRSLPRAPRPAPPPPRRWD